MSTVQQRVAVVTGGSRGIGEAIVRRLVAESLAVAAVDIDAAGGQLLVDELAAAGGTVKFFGADVTDEAQVASAIDAVVESFGRIDVLVNNAGRGAYFDAVTMSSADWDSVFDVDLKASWLMCRSALPHLVEAGQGAVVNISSIHGTLTIPGMFPYAAAKSALEGLTRSLALDFGPRGVRINAVAPGFTRTALVQEWLDTQDDPQAAKTKVDAAHPLRYIAEPADVAEVVAFLSSPQARAVTGAVYAVDCGLSVMFCVG